MLVGLDLKPATEKLEVFVEDVYGVRVRKWNELTEDCGGVRRAEFTLSRRPVLGSWKVYAVTKDGRTFNASFYVTKKGLPSFGVYIAVPAFIRNWQICPEISVSARYFYGEPVSGQAIVTVSVRGDDGSLPLAQQTPVVLQQTISGKVHFNVCLAEIFDTDTMKAFRGSLYIDATVTSTQGTTVTAFDDSCVVRRPLVDLRFSQSTRKYFKPGFPYSGQIKVLYPDTSPADDVVLEVKIVSGSQNFIAQEITAWNGVAEFRFSQEITTDVAWLEAKVVKIKKEVVLDFPAIYQPLVVLKLPNACDLAAIALGHTYKVGENASFVIDSSCTCGVAIYYEVTSKGNILDSGDIVTTQSDTGGCRNELKLMVTADMLPSVRVLFYHIINDRLISDYVRFTVIFDHSTQINLKVPQGGVAPKDNVQLLVEAEPGSCVCLAAVDSSTLLYHNTTWISTKHVNSLLSRYTLQESNLMWPFGNNNPTKRRRKRGYWWQKSFIKAISNIFAANSLVIMSDVLVMDDLTPPSTHIENQIYFIPGLGEVAEHQRVMEELNAQESLARIFFPETWIWSCFPMSTTTATRNFTVPATLTTWTLQATSLSQVSRLGIGPVHYLTVQKQFLVEMQAPKSLVEQESCWLPVRIFNSLDSCVKVRFSLKLDGNVLFEDTLLNQRSLQIYLNSNDTYAEQMNVIFTEPGEFRITATATALSSRICQKSNSIGEADGADDGDDGNEVASDIVTRKGVVVALGKLVHASTSIYICSTANGTSTEEVLTVEAPINAITGSQSGYLTISGDILGTSVLNVERLVDLPSGGGEQNLVHFTPAVHLLRYLEQTHQLTSQTRQTISQLLNTCYMDQLSFRLSDGSFSAFGKESDPWLTAFTAKSFAAAKQYVNVDDDVIRTAKTWLFDHQQLDGSFEGNKGLIAGSQEHLHDKLLMTAYVAAALVEIGASTERDNKAIAAARIYLENHMYLLADPHVAAVTTYALTMLGSRAALLSQRIMEAILQQFEDSAQRQSAQIWSTLDGWTQPDQPDIAGTYRPTSSEIETCGYALMAYLMSNNLERAVPLAHWLACQTNRYGGFLSTQDTVVALQALTEFAEYAHKPSINHTVSIVSTTLNLNVVATVNASTGMLQQRQKLPSIPTKLLVTSTGDGCALIQANIQYNVLHESSTSSDTDAFSVQVHVTKSTRLDNPDEHRQDIIVHVCLRWTAPGQSVIIVADVTLPTGYEVTGVQDATFLQMEKYELEDRKIFLYFSQIPSNDSACVSVLMQQKLVVEHQQTIPVTVYTYYEPLRQTTVFYSMDSHSTHATGGEPTAAEESTAVAPEALDESTDAVLETANESTGHKVEERNKSTEAASKLNESTEVTVEAGGESRVEQLHTVVPSAGLELETADESTEVATNAVEGSNDNETILIDPWDVSPKSSLPDVFAAIIQLQKNPDDSKTYKEFLDILKENTASEPFTELDLPPNTLNTIDLDHAYAGNTGNNSIASVDDKAVSTPGNEIKGSTLNNDAGRNIGDEDAGSSSVQRAIIHRDESNNMNIEKPASTGHEQAGSIGLAHTVAAQNTELKQERDHMSLTENSTKSMQMNCSHDEDEQGRNIRQRNDSTINLANTTGDQIEGAENVINKELDNDRISQPVHTAVAEEEYLLTTTVDDQVSTQNITDTDGDIPPTSNALIEDEVLRNDNTLATSQEDIDNSVNDTEKN
ncbi:PREDICTED: C3 and PZP-like alpha-2-macroglobulin domain-containing protein 8 [Priapulus caudatus]|uniref:C3 and PZP-like alpha-2-macroglobulin domain-containing protein 8 n=1 Tax=Priapulus caudatus TaxID=37621 RepID=A0ABM1ELZ2_PRICU|nr:PREDICTED: C3 and PZP-like alpha-2-macroglobulin domain-containing protein 8 [Priapulus caudatus]